MAAVVDTISKHDFRNKEYQGNQFALYKPLVHNH